MSRRLYVGLLVAAVGCTGAESKKLTVQEYQARQVRGMLSAQQLQVRSIPDPEVRASAMRQMALSAAYGKDAAAADKVLADLKGHPSHDEVAAECAAEFKRAGLPREARRMANRVEDANLRAGTLAKLDAKPEETTEKAETSATNPAE